MNCKTAVSHRRQVIRTALVVSREKGVVHMDERSLFLALLSAFCPIWLPRLESGEGKRRWRGKEWGSVLTKFDFVSLDLGCDVIRNDKLGLFVTKVTTCLPTTSTLARSSIHPILTKVLAVWTLHGVWKWLLHFDLFLGGCDGNDNVTTQTFKSC